MLQLCEVYEYTQGLIEKPNLLLDPLGTRNWTKNNNYAKHLLTSNITTTEMMNLRRPTTSFDCWNQLVATYEIKTHDMIVAYTRNLHSLRAMEGDLGVEGQHFVWQYSSFWYILKISSKCCALLLKLSLKAFLFEKLLNKKKTMRYYETIFGKPFLRAIQFY
jgi:gag-polypeptide of LTR copia-type